MPWLQLTLDAADLDPEALSAWFESAGALSVTFEDAADQPLFEPDPGDTPLWSSTRVVALFETGLDTDALRRRLAASFGEAAACRLRTDSLEDRDWERVWLDDFHPMCFGDRLWICPAGQRPEGQPDAVLIDLDPGLAFGTGTHPTTVLCLRWLDAHPPRGRDVIDYGCGSGILAIAALKLGAARVRATDIDEQALWATHDNACRNAVADRLATCPPARLDAAPADLLLANILANPLIGLAEQLAGRVRPGGDLVLSGILAEQAEAVAAAYRPWFAVDAPEQQDGWVCLHATRLQP